MIKLFCVRFFYLQCLHHSGNGSRVRASAFSTFYCPWLWGGIWNICGSGRCSGADAVWLSRHLMEEELFDILGRHLQLKWIHGERDESANRWRTPRITGCAFRATALEDSVRSWQNLA